jgi:O-antigen/teichoic acid export membrane protein
MKLKQFAALRFLSVGLEIIFGFIQPFLFHKFFNDSAFAFILLLYGYAVYFSFFDVGFGKLAYAKIRSKYVQGKPVKNEVEDAIIFYTSLFLIIAFFFALFALVFSTIRQSPFLPIVLVLFSINIAGNIVFTFLRGVFNAFDASATFEKYDIIRKVINIGSLILIAVDNSLLTTQVCTIGGIALLFFFILRHLYRQFGIKFQKSWLNIFRQLSRLRQSFAETKFIFVFSIFEALIYNSGYILIPIFLTNRDIIQYGLWMKISMGIATLMRVITDVMIHPLTRTYFNNQMAAARSVFNKTIFASLGLVLAACLSFYLIQDIFMAYWVDSTYIFNNALLLTLLMMLAGNGLQHVSGSFLLSLGNKYKWMSMVSGTIAFCSVFLPAIAWWHYKSLQAGLLIATGIYLTGSFVYFYKARKTLAHPL